MHPAPPALKSPIVASAHGAAQESNRKRAEQSRRCSEADAPSIAAKRFHDEARRHWPQNRRECGSRKEDAKNRA